MTKGRRIDARGRSKGEGKHVRLYPYLLESAAYRSLSCKARALYIELKLLFNGYNNGELYMSIRTAAERLGTSPNTAQKALRELYDRGFIKPHVKGSYNWKIRHATSWILTEHEFTGHSPTKEFMRWTSPNLKTELKN